MRLSLVSDTGSAPTKKAKRVPQGRGKQTSERKPLRENDLANPSLSGRLSRRGEKRTKRLWPRHLNLATASLYAATDGCEAFVAFVRRDVAAAHRVSGVDEKRFASATRRRFVARSRNAVGILGVAL